MREAKDVWSALSALQVEIAVFGRLVSPLTMASERLTDRATIPLDAMMSGLSGVQQLCMVADVVIASVTLI